MKKQTLFKIDYYVQFLTRYRIIHKNLNGAFFLDILQPGNETQLSAVFLLKRSNSGIEVCYFVGVL